jgi:ABC-type bacteriocin/lantibiotic exporter with double-glycine peptidase domain
MIRFRGTSFSYRRGATVIANLDLEIGPGLTLLLGENGCGKSTLLN